MPELPDITVYVEALGRRVMGRVLERIRIANLFVLRTAVPPIESLAGRRVVAMRRLGKRIVFGFEGDRWLVLHLMIAGRLQWADPSTDSTRSRQAGSGPARARPKTRNALATFVFENAGKVISRLKLWPAA